MGTSFKLKNGLLLLSTEAPGGVYNAEQLKKIAALCAGEEAVAKATEDQRLALFVVPAKAAAVAAQLKSVGLGVRHYQDGLHQPINCLGALCGEHLQDAMGTSMDLADELAGVVLDQPLKIGINGCSRCCLATHTLDISIIGDTSGYRISLGGKNSQLPEMASFMAEGVPAAKLPKLISNIISVYKQIAEHGESLQEVLERAGTQKFIAALAPYSQDAAQSDPFGAGAGPAAPASTEEDDMTGDGLKIDDLSGDSAFDAPGIDAAINSEGLDADPSFDDTDLSATTLSGGPEAISDSLGDSVDEFAIEVDAEDEFGDVSLPASAVAQSAQPEDLADESGDIPPLEGDDEFENMNLDTLTDDVSAAEVPAEGADADGFALEDLPADDSVLAADSQGTEDNAFAVADLPAVESEIAGEFAPEQGSSTVAAAANAPDEDDLALDEPLLDDLAFDEQDAVPDLELDADFGEEPSVAPAAAKPVLVPAAAAAVAMDVVEDEMMADEIADADVDAFEQKLSASIAEEGSLPEIEDLNSDDRLAAMEMVTSGEGEDPPSQEQNDLSMDGLSDDELSESLSDDIPAFELSGDELSESIADDIAAVRSLELVDDSDPDMAEVADFEPHVALPEPQETQVKPMAKEAPRAISTVKGFEFTGLDITADGKIALQFASGAALEIDPASLVLSGRRELKLAGKSIVLVAQKGGLNVEIEGVAIFVPNTTQAAA